MLRVSVRFVLWALAIGATGFALKLNLDLAGLMYPNDAAAKLNYQAFAVGSALAKLALPAAMAVLVGLPRGAKVVAWAVVGLCVAYDTLGAVAYDDLTRGVASNQQHASANIRAGLEAERDDWRRRADAVQARTVGEIDADEVTAAAQAKGCGVKYALTEDRCTRPATLKGERARAEEKARHLAEWERTRKALESLKPGEPPPADALANAFLRIARMVGLSPSSEFLAFVNAFKLIIFTEIAPPLVSFFAMHGVGRTAPAAPPRAPGPPAPPAPRSGGRKPSPAQGADVLAALQELAAGSRTGPGVTGSGKSVSGSQRALAAAAGVSAAKLNAAIRQLEAAGSLHVLSGPAGTTLQIK